MMNKKAQNITEYAIIFGVIATALVAMSMYFQRGIQAVVKVPVDHLGGFGTNMFNAQHIQEMGMEPEGFDWDYSPTVPVEQGLTKIYTEHWITTSPGGERYDDICEIVEPFDDADEYMQKSRTYGKIKHDQVSQ